MKRIKTILVAAMMIVPVLCIADGFEIRGQIPDVVSGSAWIQLAYNTDGHVNHKLPEKVRIVNGEFVLKGKMEHPDLVVLHVSTKKLRVLLENSSYTLSATFSELSEASLKGGQMHEAFMKFNKMEFQDVSQFIRDNPEETFSGWLAWDNYKEDRETLGQLFAILSENVKASYFGKETEKLLNSASAGLLGKKVPPVILTAPDGEKFGFGAYKGKYLVVDFWASWCGPCRKFIPELTQIYNVWKPKGVQFLSISLDDKAEKWKDALAGEKMPWPQGLAEKGFTDEGLKKVFNFTTIPFMVIIAPDGTVVSELDYRKKERLNSELLLLIKN